MKIKYLGPLLLAVGCSSVQHRDLDLKPDPVALADQNDQLADLEAQLENADWDKAEQGFQKFIQAHPYSSFLSRAKIGLSRAYIGEQKYGDAQAQLQNVLESSLATQPEFVAQAALYASFAYDGQGESEKSFAALLSAEQRKNDLPPDVAHTTLPARLAIAYNQLQDYVRAEKYFVQAQEGVESVYRGKGASERQHRAQLYFQMGEFASQSEVDGDAVSLMQALQYVQLFSLRAVEEADPVWSPKAKQDLIESYRNIWNSIMQNENDREAMLNQYLTLIQKMRALQAPEGIADNSDLKEFFAFLQKIEARAQGLLLDAKPLTPLTAEAKKRDGLKREGTVYSDPVFRREKNWEKNWEKQKKTPPQPLNLPERDNTATKLKVVDPNLTTDLNGH